MTMKKKPAVLLALMLAAALLTACGSGQPKAQESAAPQAATSAPATDAPATEAPATDAPATEAPAAAASITLGERALAATLGAAADLVPFTADELADMTGIAPEDCADFIFLQGDGMDGREILAVTAKDKDAGDRVKQQMEAYLQRRRDENRNYAPAAFLLLSDARVVRKGLTVVLISGANAATETELLLAGE